MNNRITIFFDGHCGLCLRSMRVLHALDWLGRLRFVDFRDEAQRRQLAPKIPFDDLNRALHIRYADGRTLKGFAAFRALAAHLPPLWLVAPFLSLPGVKPIGDRVYGSIAARRKRCHGVRERRWRCTHEQWSTRS